MKALWTLAAVGVMAAGALAGGENCSAQAKADCAAQCTKNKEVQVVNASAQEGSCAASCAAKSGAQVVNAASKDGACAASCADMEAQKVAMIARAKEIGMPMASFAVGDKETCCPIEAIAMWEQTGTMPVATISGKKYECLETAMNDWQGQLSEKLASMTQVSYVVNGTETQCSVEAGKLAESCHKPVIARVANREFSCQESAKATALKAVQAADAVPFVMTVAGTEYHCPMTAADASRLTGEKVIYKVNGVETCCKQTAMCMLLASRIMATANALETTQTVADTGA